MHGSAHYRRPAGGYRGTTASQWAGGPIGADVLSGHVEAALERSPTAPASFLRLAGHPVRWRLLSELARSDRRVSELSGLLGQPQSLISYHLSRLQSEQLLRALRSSADRRETYYSLDLRRCGDLLAAVGPTLHPGLRLSVAAPAQTRIARRRGAKPRVLFLCTGNSARSQIAEALLREMAGNAVTVRSAGSHPKPIHPNTIRVLHERGLDGSPRRSRHVDEFTGQHFDWVITLCDRVREVCPEFPGHPDVIHWSMPDPASEGETNEDTYPAFNRTANELATRMPYLVELIALSAGSAQG